MMNWGSVNMRGKLTKKLGCLCCVAFNGKRLSEYSNRYEKFEIESGISEFREQRVLIESDIFDKLFPNSETIEVAPDFLYGYEILIVDGEIVCDYDFSIELLSFAYHDGISYTDYNDLRMQYDEYLLENNRYDFLP